MTLSQALFIKWLRIQQEGSWRYVADKYYQRYELKIPYTDKFLWEYPFPVKEYQYYGMGLCDKAMKLLNEKTEDGWN